MNDALYHASHRGRIVMFDRFAKPMQTKSSDRARLYVRASYGALFPRYFYLSHDATP
jgi:hypothetical protein